MNYLQYIHSIQSNEGIPSDSRFLVSGVDAQVRRLVGQHIVDTCRRSGKILFLVDNTLCAAAITDLGDYRIANILDGGVSLCEDLLEVCSENALQRLRAESRLTGLLTGLGFDALKASKTVSYLAFVRETENRLGNTAPLSADTLALYGTSALVQGRLRELCARGLLSREDYDYLILRYSELCSAAAEFEQYLGLLAPLMDGSCPPDKDTAVLLPLGEFADHKPLQNTMIRFLLVFARQHADDTAVLVLDDGKGDRSFLMDLMTNLPNAAPLHLLTADAFSLDEHSLNTVMNTFPVRIYSRHDAAASCERIERVCGSVDVVKRSRTVSVDRRLFSGNTWDLLFGLNKTDSETRNVPVREPKIRREKIQTMGPGTGIIDCAGVQTLFRF